MRTGSVPNPRDALRAVSKSARAHLALNAAVSLFTGVSVADGFLDRLMLSPDVVTALVLACAKVLNQALHDSSAAIAKRIALFVHVFGCYLRARVDHLLSTTSHAAIEHTPEAYLDLALNSAVFGHASPTSPLPRILREMTGQCLAMNVGSRAGGRTVDVLREVRPGLVPHTRARVRVRTTIVTTHDGTRRAGSLQAVDLLPLALWFGVFSAVTGICRRPNSRAFMERFVQMGLVSTDARASWRPDALATLKQWLGESAKDWMVEGGGLAVNSRHIESEVRVWGLPLGWEALRLRVPPPRMRPHRCAVAKAR
jgi:hypothetical protein